MNNMLENSKISQMIYKNLENIDLIDVIELEFLQEFQNTFSNATGMATSILNKDGKLVTKPSNFSDFCMKHTRGSCEGTKRCARSDSLGASKSSSTGKPVVYYCENGLIDFAAPIMLKGKKIGSIIGGQVLAEPPDEEKFKKIAEEIGVDIQQYISALNEIKIISIEQIEAAADLLFLVATQISKIGYQRVMLLKISDALQQQLLQITTTTEELNISAQKVINTQSILNREIQNVSDATKHINDIVEDIKTLAGKSRLLGLNASIEAARVGKEGLGFRVVAEEIQRLSDLSKNTVSNIKRLTEDIKKNANTTVEISDSTLLASKQQEEATNQIMSAIEELVGLAEELNNLSSET